MRRAAICSLYAYFARGLCATYKNTRICILKDKRMREDYEEFYRELTFSLLGHLRHYFIHTQSRGKSTNAGQKDYGYLMAAILATRNKVIHVSCTHCAEHTYVGKLPPLLPVRDLVTSGDSLCYVLTSCFFPIHILYL